MLYLDSAQCSGRVNDSQCFFFFFFLDIAKTPSTIHLAVYQLRVSSDVHNEIVEWTTASKDIRILPAPMTVRSTVSIVKT